MKYLWMILFPKAKINIGLRITGKRPDGYHNLQTIFYPVCLYDALEFVVPSEQLADDELTSSGIIMDCPSNKNLVIKALWKVREYRHVPFLKIHLHKAIPAGAGLGGGSSDAASFIKGLNRYFSLGFSLEKMKDISLTIGSDCPFFIDGIPVYAEGRGEITRPVEPLPGSNYLVLIKPEIDISTKEAFSESLPVMRESDLPAIYQQDISTWKEVVTNDFETAIFMKHPQIGEIKEYMYRLGALYSSMSGSGSSVYGIFRSRPEITGPLNGNIIYSGKL